MYKPFKDHLKELYFQCFLVGVHFLTSMDNKEAWGRTTVPVDQHHGKRSLKKYQSKDLRKCFISDKMDGKEDVESVENAGTEHVSESSECKTEGENVKTKNLRPVMGMVNRD